MKILMIPIKINNQILDIKMHISENYIIVLNNINQIIIEENNNSIINNSGNMSNNNINYEKKRSKQIRYSLSFGCKISLTDKV